MEFTFYTLNHECLSILKIILYITENLERYIKKIKTTLHALTHLKPVNKHFKIFKSISF